MIELLKISAVIVLTAAGASAAVVFGSMVGAKLGEVVTGGGVRPATTKPARAA